MADRDTDCAEMKPENDRRVVCGDAWIIADLGICYDMFEKIVGDVLFPAGLKPGVDTCLGYSAWKDKAVFVLLWNAGSVGQQTISDISGIIQASGGRPISDELSDLKVADLLRFVETGWLFDRRLKAWARFAGLSPYWATTVVDGH
jgi:hypothetical protein